MLKTFCTCLFTLALLTATSAARAEHHGANLVWETEAVMAQPESVIYDGERKQLYVSSVNGPPNEANGKGFLSILATDGQVINRDWVTTLHAPKGLAIYDDILYVADINRLVAVDLETGQIIVRYPAQEAKFLNDVVADDAGHIYVSDMMDNTIYRLADGRFERWLHSSALMTPNGLQMYQGKLLAGGWGILSEGFATSLDGHLKTIDLRTRRISSLGNGQPVGNIDGIEQDAWDSFLVTDWLKGKLLRVWASGKSETLLNLKQGSADIAYLRGERLVLVPMMLDNTVRAYRLTD